jgi:alpha-galactosidase
VYNTARLIGFGVLAGRSWNQMGWYITDKVLLQAADGLIDTSRPINGKPAGTSLKDLGYGEVGMDEGWAVCPPSTGGPGGRNVSIDPRASMKRQQVPAPGFPLGGGKYSMYHLLNSTANTISPVVDQFAFPDMKGLVDKIHDKGLRAGWYLNDCLSYCATQGDHCPAKQCIPGDVKAFAEYGFDSLKLDGCSSQKDINLWAELVNKTGIRARIENCHNGGKGPPAGSTPLTERCPAYHQYRIGRDIGNSYISWMFNAEEMASFVQPPGRSGPTCWAYPVSSSGSDGGGGGGGGGSSSSSSSSSSGGGGRS